MRLIAFGDSKGKDNGINQRVLTKILRLTSKLNPQPELIVMCGDNVAGSMEEEKLLSQLGGLKELIQKYHPSISILPIVGNHEVNGNPVDDRFERILSKAYSDLAPDGFLQDYNNTSYYKDFGDARIIVLNAFHYGAVHKIGKEQLNWLGEVLAQAKKYNLVFVHSPAFPTGAHINHCLNFYPEERDAFWSIIDGYHVNLVISAHEHNYSRREIGPSLNKGHIEYKNSIYQIITGGAGEKLRDKCKDKTGIVLPPIAKHHFVIVDITPEGIKVCAISAEGKKLDDFEIL